MAKTTAGQAKQFGRVPTLSISRSTFDRSHRHTTTFDADYLIPILVDDIMPGDSFSVNCNVFGRLATPLFPIMDNIYVETFFFFVPYRLVWDNWEKFCGAQDDPGDSISYTIPVVNTGMTANVGELAQYMGIPEGASTTTHTDISVLPFRAFRLIFNEWFRDQNLTDSLTLVTDDGPDTQAETGFNQVPPKRGKRHDYLTSCLPWPQKQTSAVTFSLGTDANVITKAAEHTTTGLPVLQFRETGGTLSGGHGLGIDGVGDLHELTTGTTGTGEFSPTNLYADLANATGVSINDFRLALQTQALLEIDARSGTRYPETVLAHFGVTVPDFRVQRPEYLGGGRSLVNITPVAQTTYQGTATDEDAKGALAGFGTVSGRHGFTKSFVEHGVLIGIANARADITYSQGIDRYWTKSTRYDFYYPVLANISEQAVLIREIYAAAADQTTVWGYQERYAEYRYKKSQLSGLMSVDASGSLSAWHLSEDFASEPSLNNAFIESNTGTPLDRAIAVSTEPHFIMDFYFQMKCARPMPVFGIPFNMSRF